MLVRLLSPVLLVTSLLITGSAGQSSGLSTTDMLKVLPECAVTCLTGVYGQGICAPNDPACSCTNAQFQQAVTVCVTSNCTIPEALSTRNITSAGCGAPVRDRAHKHTVIGGTLVAMSIAAVLVRFGYRIFVAKADLGPEDWLILTAILCVIPSLIVSEAGTVPNGLGKDLYTLSPKQITDFLYYFWVMAWLYFLHVVLTKLSIQFFFLRIFPSQLAHKMLWGTIAFTALWGVAFVVACLSQCTPITYNWTKWDGLHEGKCINITAFAWSHAVISIAIDCWMLALPLWQIKGLQMSLKKKIGVALMFFVGTFVTVISIVRLHSLVIFTQSQNVTYDYFDVSVWSSIEVNVGIICACMPSIRQALTKLFPALMRGSSLGKSYGRHKSTSQTDPTIVTGGGRAGWKNKLSHSNSEPRGTIDPHHGYRLEGPNAGSTHVVVHGGHVALSTAEKGQVRNHQRERSGIVVLQERSVHDMGAGEADDFAGGDVESRSGRSSERGDEVTLVEMKNLSPRSQW